MDRNRQQNEELQPSFGLENNRARLWSSVIVDALIKGGVEDFYLSPGMRNAPLIAALLKRPKANLHVVIDERAASYRALGASKLGGKTSCLICTSGTALANYLPALIEARKTGTPILAISADRPPELTFSDANQTINQHRLFSGADIYSHSLQAPHDQISLHAIVGEVLHLLGRTKAPQPGPVHLNIPFREPLDHNTEKVSRKQIEEARALLKDTSPLMRLAHPNLGLPPDEANYLKHQLTAAKRPLLVVGGLSPAQIGPSLKAFTSSYRGAKLLDATSSLKYQFTLEDGAIPTFEHEEIKNYLSYNRPDLILQLGGRLTSKFYYQFLEENPAIPLMVVNSGSEREDPSFRVNYRYHGEVESFARDFLPLLQTSEGHAMGEFAGIVERKEAIIDASPMTYPVLSKTVLELIPDQSALYLGNSTVIRTFDSYASRHNKKDLTVLTNRGVSGIEGLVASALGARDKLDPSLPLTLVNGDIATIHDLNSLLMLRSVKAPFVFIIANNSCGGIFSLLPIAAEEELAQIIRSPIEVDYTQGEKFFGVKILKVHTKEDFIYAYKEAVVRPQATILEVVFSDRDNSEIYRQLRTLR